MLSIFILAMLLHPDAQRSAQKQIDAIVGRGRMPTTTDLSDLPYIRALVSELFRWLSVAPTGVVRCSTQVRTYF